MIAIRVHKTGGPEVLRLENVPDPEPGPGELVIEVLAIGVNYIEIYQREGQYTLPKPFTPGGEASMPPATPAKNAARAKAHSL